MKCYKISQFDVLNFNDVIATFILPEDEDIIESSQPPAVLRKKSKAFVIPETDYDCFDRNKIDTQRLTEDVEIPETQFITENQEQPETTNNTADISEKDQNSNYEMLSQNVFGDETSCQIDPVDVLDDDLDDVEINPAMNKTLALYSRDGSTTPEIDDLRPPAYTTEHTMQPRDQQSEIESHRKVQIKPELNAQLDDTQIMEHDSNDNEKENFNLMQETQPISISFKTRNQLKRQSEIKPSTVSLKEFYETDNLSLPPKKRHCFLKETQPVLPPKKARVSDKTVNRILLTSDDDSEQETLIKQNACVGNDNITIAIQKIITELIPKAEESVSSPQQANSYLLTDMSTPDIIPRLPRDSQMESILKLVNNETESFNNDDAVDFDTMNSEESDADDIALKQLLKPQPRRQIPKRARRKIMQYVSDSDSDEPLVNVLKKVTKQKQPVKTKVLCFAISNNEDAKTKLEKCCNDLGGKIVEKVAQADVLLTNSILRPTSKVLAAICKGIPIVCDEFMDESIKAGKWLNPQDYILHGSKVEKNKKFNLKSSIEKASKQKLFEKSSVFVTKNTMIPFDQLKEIIENAGGECLKPTEKPAYENLFLCTNADDKDDVKSIKKKYSKITEIVDSTLSTKFLRQML